VVVVQRTSSDLKLNPHLHVLLLDGVYRELDAATAGFTALPHLSTREVGEVLERAVARIVKHLRRRGLLATLEGEILDEPADIGGLTSLAASAVSGQSPPAGPEWRRKHAPLPALVSGPLHYDKPLCASKDGFTLHAATRAGAMDTQGREALCKYVLRPAVAQERITHRPDGLVRISLKKPFADGTVAVDMDPLSLLCRLAASVPPAEAPYRSLRGRARSREQAPFAHRAQVTAARTRVLARRRPEAQAHVRGRPKLSSSEAAASWTP